MIPSSWTAIGIQHFRKPPKPPASSSSLLSCQRWPHDASWWGNLISWDCMGISMISLEVETRGNRGLTINKHGLNGISGFNGIFFYNQITKHGRPLGNPRTKFGPVNRNIIGDPIPPNSKNSIGTMNGIIKDD